MKCMIFAAGLGTRLGKITNRIPKALVKINGKSLLRIAVEKCVSEGFDEIIINIHHHPERMYEEVKRLKKLGYDINVSDETDLLLDTGGGLYKALNLFDDNPFLVYNVDIVTDISLKDLYNYHTQHDGLATLLTPTRNGNRFLLVDDDNRLCGWCNKATEEKIISRDIPNLSEISFCGIHIISPEIFSLMRYGVYSLTPLYLELAKTHDIYTYKDNSGYWFDVGTPEKLKEARKALKSPEWF